jgi:hypothetical protein
MKPFDLQKALAGEPVVTRDGREVTQLTKFDAPNCLFPIAAVVAGELETFSIGGKFRIGGETKHDLFMATKTVKKEGWVNVYKNQSNDIECGHVFKNPEEAAKYSNSFRIATTKIEWEEEV